MELHIKFAAEVVQKEGYETLLGVTLLLAGHIDKISSIAGISHEHRR